MCSFFSRKSLLVLSNAQNFLAARATPEARRGPWVWHLKTFTFPDMTCKCYTFSLFESTTALVCSDFTDLAYTTLSFLRRREA